MTPVRNEAWVIKPFVQAAQCWATAVIVADQNSTDGTLQLLQQTAGVDVVINDSPIFDENHRQRLLLDRARTISGKRILIALDADEAISANFATSAEWKELDSVAPGTILRFRWANVLPGFEYAWIPPQPTIFGFVDDGSDHKGTRIHSTRVPRPDNAPILDVQDVVVLHFQYVVWERMISKQRWYQAWEHTTNRKKSPLQIFREYNHMFGGWAESEIHPVKPEWLEGYTRAGIDFRALKPEPVMWWDQEVIAMLREHGPRHFRKLAIWNQDWNAVADRLGLEHGDLSDPRSMREQIAHRLLAATQKDRATWPARALERCLRMAGW
jgi:hypothetical protein